MSMQRSVKRLGLLAAAGIVGLAVLGAPSVSHAVPCLQVYIEGATYDATNETWVLNSDNNTGTVNIIATTQNGSGPVKPVNDVVMVVSATTDTSFTASLNDGSTTVTKDSSAGNSPILNGGDANTATSYVTFDLGDFTSNSETTYDTTGGGTGHGQTETYVLTLTGLTGTVIIDAYGYDSSGKLVKAPYSHNGAINAAVPELAGTGIAPAAGLLLGAALLFSRRRRS